jgi:Tol biopolymer transport system component/putative cell wall-binding protein
MSSRRRSGMVFRPIAVLAGLAMLLTGVNFAPAVGPVGVTTRVSVAPANVPVDASSAAISADGRYVAFQSLSPDLVPGDTNVHADVFVYDRESAEMSMVSVATDGTPGNNESGHPSISGDGRYVAFHSAASNLVPGDTNNQCDVFVHDRQTGETTRVSVASDGTEGNRRSYAPAISADGRRVAFQSMSSNFVPGMDNEARDVFVHDRETGQTVCISVGFDGTCGNGRSQHPSVSADGRYVAFHSSASNLVPDDTNGHSDVFVRDLSIGKTTRVSVATNGSETTGERGSYHASISADGKFVAFHSWAPNLVAGDSNRTCDVFVHEMRTGATTRVSVSSIGAQGNAQSEMPSISADGRYIAFDSGASNLVPDDRNGLIDVFVNDRRTGDTVRVSVGTGNKEADGASRMPSMSADGKSIAFESFAHNIVQKNLEDTTTDVFVHERGAYVSESTAAVRMVPVNRLEGQTRFDTAVAISEHTYPQGLDPTGHRTVVIVSGRRWCYALVGSSLAGALDGPVLLTDINHVPDSILDEIQRLGAVKAVVIGCEDSVHESVDVQLAKVLGAENVERICADCKFEVTDRVAARVIALQDGRWDGKAFLVTGDSCYESRGAFAVAPIIASQGWPIYFTHPEEGLLPKTRAAMHAVRELVIAGGEECVSAEVEEYFKEQLGAENVERIQGETDCCYAGAVEIANWAVANTGLSWDGVVVTAASRSGDVLGAGLMQAKLGSVILFTDSGDVNECALEALRGHESDISHVIYVGERRGTRGPEQALGFEGVDYLRIAPSLKSD